MIKTMTTPTIFKLAQMNDDASVFKVKCHRVQCFKYASYEKKFRIGTHKCQ